jgi:hypothetical protein
MKSLLIPTSVTAPEIAPVVSPTAKPRGIKEDQVALGDFLIGKNAFSVKGAR